MATRAHDLRLLFSILACCSLLCTLACDRSTTPKSSPATHPTTRALADDLHRMLADARTFELLSLEPVGEAGEYHGCKILGRTTIVDRVTQQNLVAALERGITEAPRGSMMCFQPHHAIRLTGAGSTTDFVICFMCLKVEVWTNNELHSRFNTSGSPQPVFNQVIRAASIPINRQADELAPDYSKPPTITD